MSYSNIIPLFPHNPRNPANAAIIVLRRAFVTYAIWQREFTQAERFRCQREIESQHAALHMEAHMRYGLVLPIVIPAYWTQDDIVDCALGIQRKPVHEATVKRVSNVREKRNARLAGQMGIGVAA